MKSTTKKLKFLNTNYFYLQIMKKFYTSVEINGYLHVLCDSEIGGNYKGTGKALCGILKKGESLNGFQKKRDERIKKWTNFNKSL